jgi:monoamine oxidase
VPPAAGMVRTSWSTDPWARGSYSFLPVGSTSAMREVLAAPLADRVFFAGEAARVHTRRRCTARSRRGSTSRNGSAVSRGEMSASSSSARASPASLLHRHCDAPGTTSRVIEARDRIGGRIDTVRPSGWPLPIERGASWIHDVDASDLAARARRLGVQTIPFDYRPAAVDLPSMRRVDAAAQSRTARRAIERAIDDAAHLDEDVSLEAALRARGATAADRVLEWFIETEITTEYGAEARELSAWWGLEEGTEGDDLLVVGGYDQLVADLAEGIDVRLGQPASAIRWSTAGASVVAADGTVHDADRLVVTLPLGVLEAGDVAFTPPLPDAKTAAIGQLGMGLLDKIWFRFEEQFWSEDALLWTRMGGEGPINQWVNSHQRPDTRSCSLSSAVTPLVSWREHLTSRSSWWPEPRSSRSSTPDGEHDTHPSRDISPPFTLTGVHSDPMMADAPHRSRGDHHERWSTRRGRAVRRGRRTTRATRGVARDSDARRHRRAGRRAAQAGIGHVERHQPLHHPVARRQKRGEYRRRRPPHGRRAAKCTPSDGPFPDYDLAMQFGIMRQLGAHTSVPVPDVLWHEDDPSWLGVPFLTMRAVSGEPALDWPSYHQSGFYAEMTGSQRRRLWVATIEVLAMIPAPTATRSASTSSRRSSG